LHEIKFFALRRDRVGRWRRGSLGLAGRCGSLPWIEWFTHANARGSVGGLPATPRPGAGASGGHRRAMFAI